MNVCEPLPIYYSKANYVLTKRQNKVSREANVCGSDSIGVQGKTIIETNSLLRGDLSTIEIGVHCIIGENAVIQPPDHKFKGGVRHIPMSIGDYVTIGPDCYVQAAAIGSYVYIGARCVVGKKCVISTCVYLDDDTVLAPGTVCPAFSHFSGNPGVMVARLPSSFQSMCVEASRTYFQLFQPAQQAQAGSQASALPPPPPSSTASSSEVAPAAAATPVAAAGATPSVESS